MLSFIPSSEYSFAICVRAGIVRVSVVVLGIGRSFFIIGGRDRLFLRLRGVLQWSIVGFARNLLRRLTRDWGVCLDG